MTPHPSRRRVHELLWLNLDAKLRAPTGNWNARQFRLHP